MPGRRTVNEYTWHPGQLEMGRTDTNRCQWTGMNIAFERDGYRAAMVWTQLFKQMDTPKIDTDGHKWTQIMCWHKGSVGVRRRPKIEHTWVPHHLS